MSEDDYPISLKVFGGFLVLTGLYLLFTSYLVIKAGTVHIADLSDKSVHNTIISTLFIAAAIAAGIGFMMKKPWSRALVIGWTFFGYLYMSLSFASMGTYNNGALFASGYGLLFFVTWFVSRKAVRTCFPKIKRERLYYSLLVLALGLIAFGWYAIWVKFDGPQLPEVAEMKMPAPPKGPETSLLVFPGRFTVKVPGDYKIFLFDAKGLSFKKEGANVLVALTKQTPLQNIGNTSPFDAHFKKPVDFVDKYLHARYGLGLTAIRGLMNTMNYQTGYSVHHISYGNISIYIESGSSGKRYTETAHIYKNGDILGGVVYEHFDKDEVSPPDKLILPGIIATLEVPGHSLSAEEYIETAEHANEAGDIYNARLYYAYALVLEPENADRYYKIAMIYWNDGNLISARNYLQKALKLSPDDERVKSELEKINKRFKREKPKTSRI